ncbi:MAG: hypothetical protein ACI9Q9_001329, partial [Flavobacterium sp.]
MKKTIFSAALFLLVSFAHAQNTDLKIKIDRKAEALESKVITWRR